MSYTWTERQPSGDANKNWWSAAIDETGQKLIAGQDAGRLFTSVDGGDSWSERQPKGNVNADWDAACAAVDWSYLFVCSSTFHRSTDGGVNWSNLLTRTYRQIACSQNGEYLLGGVFGGRLYTSSDYGSNWTERQPGGASNLQWYGVGVSQSGQYMIAGVQAGRLYTSSDYGVNWTERQPAGAANQSWKDVAVSGSGEVMVAVINGGRVWLSTNYGVNWTEKRPHGLDSNLSWTPASISNDGQIICVGTYNATTGTIYRSVDGGTTWAVDTPASPKLWLKAIVNKGGRKIVAASTGSTAPGGRLYTGVEPYVEGSTGILSGETFTSGTVTASYSITGSTGIESLEAFGIGVVSTSGAPPTRRNRVLIIGAAMLVSVGSSELSRRQLLGLPNSTKE